MLNEARWWKYLVWGAAVAASACATDGSDSVDTSIPTTTSVISGVGHGSFLLADGTEVTPTLEAVKATQRSLIDKLLPEAKDAAETRALIDASIDDAVIADATYIAWMLDTEKPYNYGTMRSVNDALHMWYVKTLPAEEQSNGEVPKDTALKLEARGMVSMLTTVNSGSKYIAECKAAGVPIPPPMYEEPWVKRGEITNEFISSTSYSELWSYESESPNGICMALPRYNSKGETTLFGVICLGRQSSKVCFWDNPRGVYFPRDVPVDITSFVGGTTLVTNGGGECTDCHAGENPFVVHPDKPPFQSLPSLLPASWYDPIVDASWRQNPGPSYVLDAVASDSECTSCHNQGYAGRFPQVQALSLYCGSVLDRAIAGSTRTMPAGGGSIGPYEAHVDKLEELCGDGVTVGESTPVDPKEDPSFISPPQVIEPLYGCAHMVSVRNSILDAKVTLLINGTPVADKISTGPSQLQFDTPVLNIGDKVTAIQEIDGAVSAESAIAYVKDWKIDYPDGLPAPSIDPTTIFECAEIIAVRNVPGADITVSVNSTDEVTSGTSTGWTAVWPGKRPFDVGDRFEAVQSLCGEKSPLSAPAYATNAPTTMNAPSFDPPLIYPGQALINFTSLINGAWTYVDELSAGNIGKFTTPISWRPDFDVRPGLGRPIISGDVITGMMTLCDKGPQNETPAAGKCEEMPAPRIDQPVAGATYVVVTQSVPGARVRVYDSGGNEIGDGMGTIVWLSRPIIAGETLTVTQQVGECRARDGYVITATRR